MTVDLGLLLTFIVALSGFLLSLRKAKHENRASDGSAALEFEQAASSIAKRNINLMARIDELEKRIIELERKLKQEIDRSHKFEDWAYRLVHQVQSFPGGVPVLMNPGSFVCSDNEEKEK